ncbi:hypothetical protein BHM03_00045984, partial [Ensete ventricosum]
MTRLNHVELFYAFVVAIGSKGSAACEPRAATCMLSAYRGWSAMARPLAGAIDYGQASATVVSCGQGRWQGQSPAGAAACKGGCLQVLLPARWPLVKATGSMGSACRVASSVGKAPARKGDRPRALTSLRFAHLLSGLERCNGSVEMTARPMMSWREITTHGDA